MKKIFFVKLSQLQIVEIKNPRLKLFGGVVSVLMVAFLLLYLGSLLFNNFLGIKNIEQENALLKEQLEKMTVAMEQLNAGFDSLLAKNNDMRLSMSLQPLSKDEIPVGVGGGYFDNKIDLLGGSSKEMLHKASSVLDIVQRKFDLQQQNLSEIYSASLQRRELFSAIPAIKPCEGSYSSSFGIRIDPFTGMRHFHAGLDIIADVGTSVSSTGDGIVVFAGPKQDYGIAIEIDHGFGYRTLYAHLSATVVSEGQKVSRGMLIGKSGNTGRSTGPHLHYEVTHNGTNLDPVEFIFNDMTVLSLQSDK